VGLREKVRQTRRWTRVTARVSCADHVTTIAVWGDKRFRVVVYRTHVQHETPKNYQLDLFDPSDGHYEYSAVATNKTIGGPALWAFMCGRGIHEKIYGELKSGLRLRVRTDAAVRGQQRLAAAQRARLQPQPQLPAGHDRLPPRPSRKRWALFGFETIHTLRALCFQRAGVLTHPHGRAVLDVGPGAAVRERFKRLDRLGGLTFCLIKASPMGGARASRTILLTGALRHLGALRSSAVPPSAPRSPPSRVA
jgi:hypothetical protein